MSFKDKVVLITGASSGIGAATAILFAKEGANVAMVGRNQEKLDKVASQCAKKPLVINADISKDEEGRRIVEKTVQTYGKLDILVNNAGMTKYGSILDGKILQVYDDVMKTNVRAAINITTEATPYLVKQKGNIINISSIAGLTTPVMPTMISYAISKAALDHFTRGAAAELAPLGVRVNSINPGPVKTDFMANSGHNDPRAFASFMESVPLKRISESEEIADLIAFLASDKARGITGSIYVSDNGCLLKI